MFFNTTLFIVILWTIIFCAVLNYKQGGLGRSELYPLIYIIPFGLSLHYFDLSLSEFYEIIHDNITVHSGGIIVILSIIHSIRVTYAKWF